jgi:hypothetical protein
MLGFLTKLLAGPIVDTVVGIVKSYQGRKVSDAEMRAEVNKAILSTLAEVTKTQGDVIMAEMRGENWLQRNWRPVTAISFVAIIVFYGILLPILVGWFGFPPVRVGDALLEWIMQAVMVCLGGYIGGRSLEKIVATLRQ